MSVFKGFQRAGSKSWLLVVGLGIGLSGCGSDTVFELVGTTERKTLELAAPVSEVIIDIPVALGQRVAAGEVVVLLDNQVAQAELRAHEAALAASEATRDAASQEFSRRERLRASGVASQQDYDRSRQARDEAVAVVAERQARIAQAKKRVEELTIRAWSSGIVDQLPFEVGERSAAGGVVAVVVTESDPWVRVWLPARAAARAQQGAAARVEVEGLDEVFSGRLEDVGREAEFTPHYALTERESADLVYRARVVIEDAPEGLRPGLAARVELIIPR